MSTTAQNRQPLSFASFAQQQRQTQGNAASNQNGKEEREPAEFWMNIGYPAQMPSTEEGREGELVTTFISVARGIPLDQIAPFDLSKERSENMAVLRDAQNDLTANLLAAAQTLEPGESRIILGDDNVGLYVELKRRKAPITVPTGPGLKRKFDFTGLGGGKLNDPE